MPWLGLLDKIAKADVWVIADDVQFTKHGYTNRNRIRTAQGWQWLTVPVRTAGRGQQRICDVAIEQSETWRRKHLEALRWNYHMAPFFCDYEQFLEQFYERNWESLSEANITLCRHQLEHFGIDVEIHMSSNLSLRQCRSERLVDMATACDCDTYLAGGGASRDYIDEAVFREAGVEIRFVEFVHPAYKQCFPGFEPNMTSLDLLFNHGTGAREVLLGR